MKLFHFGTDERTLFGAVHGPATSDCAVLLVPPFGHEAVRAHRLFKSLAERLARKGKTVLRFDPYGTGDSGGDDKDVELLGLKGDVLTAHWELAQRSGATRMIWVGLRLGASACALAASEAVSSAGLIRMLLCTPVANGSEYLEELRARHVEILDSCLGVPPSPRAQVVAARSPDAYREEALGYAISNRMRQQLSDYTLHSHLSSVPQDSTVLVEASTVDAAAADFPRSCLREGAVVEHVDWLSDVPVGGVLVPGALLNQLQAEVERLSA